MLWNGFIRLESNGKAIFRMLHSRVDKICHARQRDCQGDEYCLSYRYSIYIVSRYVSPSELKHHTAETAVQATSPTTIQPTKQKSTTELPASHDPQPNKQCANAALPSLPSAVTDSSFGSRARCIPSATSSTITGPRGFAQNAVGAG
jgi:hypothetical protein